MFRRIINNRIYISAFGNQFLKLNTTYNPLQRYTRNVSAFYVVPQASKLHQRYYSEKANAEPSIVDFYYVKNAISNPNILIVDVREPEEIKELGKIPSSINIPIDNVSTALSNLSDSEFQTTYQRPKPTENSEIIFYCKIGRRSGMASQAAINLGYTNVKNYLGSFTEWASKIGEQQGK